MTSQTWLWAKTAIHHWQQQQTETEQADSKQRSLMILACHPQWPQVNEAVDGATKTATAVKQISRWLREKRVCNLLVGGEESKLASSAAA